MDNQEVEKDSGSDKLRTSNDYVPNKPYSKLKRDLADEDLNNTAVQKILISEIDRLEFKIIELESIKQKFHDLDKQNGILSEQLKSIKSHDILYSVCLSIGSTLIGLTSMFSFKTGGWIFLVMGCFLIISGIISKVRK